MVSQLICWVFIQEDRKEIDKGDTENFRADYGQCHCAMRLTDSPPACANWPPA